MVSAAFGSNTRVLGDPWRDTAVHPGGVTLSWVKIWTAITALGVLLLFFLFDRYTKYGLAMRVTASDEEAAISAGVPTRRVHALVWGLAGAVATVGGFFLAGFPANVNGALGASALRAFPAIILGGLDSPAGALVGGIIIGIVEGLTAGYQPDHASWLGSNFYIIA